MKKLIIFLIIIIISISAFLLLNYTRSPKIEITLAEDLTIEFLDTKKVSDFIISINGTITDDFFIDTTSIGKKIVTVTVAFNNYKRKKDTYSYEVTVIDTVAPVIWLNDSYTVTVRRRY